MYFNGKIPFLYWYFITKNIEKQGDNNENITFK